MKENITQYSTKKIEKAIIALGITYEKNGPDNKYLGFFSFRNCQNYGIYFAVDNIAPPRKVSHSLFLCNTIRQDLIDSGNTILIINDPQSTYYKLLNIFNPIKPKSSIHWTAIIDEGAVIENSVEIGPYCVIGKAVIKSGTCLCSNVVIYDNTIIESDVKIEPFTCIGATGAAWSFDEQSGKRIIQPQLGGVVVGKNSFIGSNITIVRGSLNENTEIGENCIIAHGTKIGHGCKVGDYTHFANNVTVAGNVDIGDFSFIGAAAVLRPQICLAEATIVAAGAVVVTNALEPDCLLIGVPAKISKNNKVQMNGIPKSFIDKRRKIGK